jgi:ATP-dependent Clp protease adaptor protein ClpS
MTIEIGPRTAPQEETQTRTRRQPPYAVVLHNDDLNGFDYVVAVLQKVFGYARERAYTLTLEADRTGRSIVWSGALEVAELKADQIRSCGPDPRQVGVGAQALGVTVEPLPGE